MIGNSNASIISQQEIKDLKSSTATNAQNITSLQNTKQDNLTPTQLAAVNSGVDSSVVNQVSTNTSNISNLSQSKQNVITSSNKLSADLVDDESTTNKFVTAQDIANWNAQYTKPANGIPKTDLTQGVQNSLDLADSALQSIDSQLVTDALGYTPYDSANPDNFITASDIPTTVSSFTNDSNYQNASQVSSAINNKAVRYDTDQQGLTSTQQLNARTNIGAIGSHQAIKTLNTSNTTAQTPESAESITGDTPLNLHKIAKTGTASDLIGYNTLAQASDLTALSSRVSTTEGDITAINSKFQSGVSANNPATSEDFVNSSINALAAFFITRTAAGDNFNTYAQLSSATTFYSGGESRIPTQNDYTYVRWDENKGEIVTGYSSFTTTADYIGHLVIYNNEGVEVTSSNKDSLGITPGTTVAYDNLPTTRYSYQGGTYPNGQWDFQLIVNNSALTAAQMAALNSGMTSADKTKLDGIQAGAEVNVQADWNQTNSSADDYIKNKPTIPTDTNQKIKTSSVTFGNDDVVELVGGANVTVTGDASTKTITISATGGSLENYVEKQQTSTQTIGDVTVTTYNNVDNEVGMTGMGSTLNRKYDVNDGTELGAWTMVHPLGIATIHTGTADTPDAQSATLATDVNIAASGGIVITQLDNNTTSTVSIDNGDITAKSFVKENGTSSQFLKADGSVDNNTYATSSELDNCVKLNAGQQTITSSSGIDTPIILKSGTASGSYLMFFNSNENLAAAIGMDSNRKLKYSAGADDWYVAMTSDLPTKTSDLTNDSGFITHIVDNLTNYYLKSETYTQSQVNALIAAIKTVKLEIVSTLPTADTTTYFNESKTIYAIRNTATTGSDYYKEYITVRTGGGGSYVYSWEKIGDTQIDLSNCVQKTFTIAGIDLQDNITKSELQTALTDSTHNFVTDTEKSTWNAKQDTLSTAQLNAVNSGIDSTKVAQIATNTTDIANKMDKVNPTGTGALSLNRKANTTIGDSSVALGTNTTASGTYGPVALCSNTVASGESSFASGYKSTASGKESTAMGNYSTASGLHSFAAGSRANASGNYSIALGRYVTAQRASQFVFGEFNTPDTGGTDETSKGNYIEIVGNGTYPNIQNNARTLDWSGNEVLAGTSQATGFKTASGTSSQFLKADGSVDNTTTTTINNKVDKTNLASKLYGTSASGTQDLHTYSYNNANSWTFVQRDGYGDVFVPNIPTGNNGATSKQYVNTYNMCPSNNIVAYTDTPQTATVLFQAPCNGVAYLRYSVKAVNASNPHYMGFHLQSSSGSDKAYNTQYWTTSGDHMYNAMFVMKAGQRVYCYEVVNLTINWGQVNFIKSEGQ